jgi:hypothetical protein
LPGIFAGEEKGRVASTTNITSYPLTSAPLQEKLSKLLAELQL